jgi:hypothetical protein
VTDGKCNTRGSRRSRLIAALAASALLAGGLASTASGATYGVESCWGAANPGIAGWTPSNTGAFTYYSNDCALNGGMSVAFNSDVGHSDGDRATYSFSAPASTSIKSLTALRTKQAGADRVSGNPRAFMEVDDVNVDDCTRAYGCTGPEEGSLGLDLTAARTIRISVVCSGPAGCPAGNTSYRLREVRVMLNDEADPGITTQPSGSLVSGQNLDRNRTLVYAASDQGGGVYRQRLSVDNVVVRNDVVNANGGKCAVPFRDPVPCRTTPVSASVDLDTSTLADGQHTLRLEVRDATDVNHTETAPWTITVDNAPPVVGAVSVTGSARAGDALTCAASVAGQSPTVSYAWMRSNADGSGQEVVSGATDPTYVQRDADVGRKVICRVAATDHGGTATKDSTVTSGPFADGATVTAYCSGRPAGPTDECGDNDGDRIPNREDPDDDNDGVPDGSDPAPFDGTLPGTPAPGPQGPTGPAGPGGDSGNPGGTTTTSTETHSSSSSTELIASDLNTVGALRNPISETIGNGQPVTNDALLAVKFVVGSGTNARSSTRVVAAYSQRLRVRGTLQTPAARAITGARVYLVQKPLGAPESAWRLDQATVTAADGTFTLPIAPSGRSRDIRVVYFPRGGSNANRGSNALSLRVRQDATFQVSRRLLHNGGKLTFSGRVLGAVPSSGVDVRVQVRLNRSWYTFTKLTTTRSKGGRFQAAHRFTKTTSPTTYRFRILVLPRNRTVYTNGFSRHIDVRVLP